MYDYIAQIKRGIDADLTLLSLAAALSLPDIFGSIETGKQATGLSYRNWYDSNVLIFYPDLLTSQECWDFRCRFLHQGQTSPKTGNYYTNIAFSEAKNVSLNLGRSIIKGQPGPKFIDVYKFVNAICDCTLKWLDVNSNDPLIEERLNQCVKRHPNGFNSIVSGVPIIF